jgi:hypothetical protein
MRQLPTKGVYCFARFLGLGCHRQILAPTKMTRRGLAGSGEGCKCMPFGSQREQ